MEWWVWIPIGVGWVWTLAVLHRAAAALERAADQSVNIAVELTQMVEAWDRWERNVHDRP